jgi:hypothetical protein
MKNRNDAQRGTITLYVLLFSTVSIILLSGFVIWADYNLRAVFRDYDAAQAFMVAEAGIEYYRWHLSHDRTDYTDGTGQPGPYIHEFRDKDNLLIGSFALAISTPATGSTVVSIESTGSTVANPAAQKIIEARMAIPSFVRFAALSGASIRFSEGTELYGPIHSNGGVRVDGVAHNLVTSAVADYNDPAHGGGCKEFGVHTHVAPTDPCAPAPVPDRPDVFQAGRAFPVAPVDFVGLSHDLANLKASAQADGFWRGEVDHHDVGYHVILKTNNTFDLYTVTDVVKAPSGCVTVLGEKDWDPWTIDDETLMGNYPLPDNGILFFEGHTWVEGQIDSGGSRITLAAAVFPENSSHYAHIIINNDLKYSSYDGQDIIGLIAQGDITVGWNSEDDLRIDGAAIAQNGRVGRFYYRGPEGNQNRCAPYHTRDTVTIFGTISSKNEYGFRYSDGTGYQHIVIIFDPNLMFNPPPNFPLISEFYSPIFWSERQ